MLVKRNYVEETKGLKRIDYLKIIIKTDAEEFQTRYQPMLNAINAGVVAAGGKQSKLTVLKPDSTGLTRYVLEWYGPGAAAAVPLIPELWYNFLYRIDWREEVPEIEADDVRRIQAYVSVAPSGKTGTSTFSTRKANKTFQTDIGGLGVRWGSRKSDKHAVLYKRSGEYAAFEFRLQGRAAQQMGAAAVEFALKDTEWAIETVLSQFMSQLARAFLHSIYQFTEPAQLMQLADQAAEQMPMMFELPDNPELVAARAWWTSLTEQEQLDWQRSQFEETAKGAKQAFDGKQKREQDFPF